MAKQPTPAAEEELGKGHDYICTRRDGSRFRLRNVRTFTKDGSGHHFTFTDGRPPSDYSDGMLTGAAPENSEEDL